MKKVIKMQNGEFLRNPKLETCGLRYFAFKMNESQAEVIASVIRDTDPDCEFSIEDLIIPGKRVCIIGSTRESARFSMVCKEEQTAVVEVFDIHTNEVTKSFKLGFDVLESGLISF